MKQFEHYTELKPVTKEEFEAVVKDRKLSLHHIARCLGYVSAKVYGEMMDYNGRFGKGVALLEHSTNSTRYCYITYYTETQN